MGSVNLLLPGAVACIPVEAHILEECLEEVAARQDLDCAVANSDTIPPMYVAQQEELNRLMSLMNSEFSRMVKFYALRHASEAIAPMEEVERARLTQLTFEGLTLELTTVDLAVESANGRLERKVWSTSVLFPMPCNDPYEVEEALIRMFAEERPREIADAAYY